MIQSTNKILVIIARILSGLGAGVLIASPAISHGWVIPVLAVCMLIFGVYLFEKCSRK